MAYILRSLKSHSKRISVWQHMHWIINVSTDISPSRVTSLAQVASRWNALISANTLYLDCLSVNPLKLSVIKNNIKKLISNKRPLFAACASKWRERKLDSWPSGVACLFYRFLPCWRICNYAPITGSKRKVICKENYVATISYSAEKRAWEFRAKH